jgi:DNA topoisomerase-1
VELHQLDDLRQPEEAAKLVGLRYVTDGMAGFRRRKSGRGFRYLYDTGKAIRDANHLARIRALAIPPAWTDVWICAQANGHLQATGHDARGRKQYRYHAGWREIRDATKYAQMIAFAKALPRIRRRVARDLKRPLLDRNRVLATVVKLLETSLIRVGNDEYARTNNSFGLTTMRNRHVDVRGARITFKFRGKSGKQHDVDVEDRRLAKVVRACQDLPGQDLFTYVDEQGNPQDVGSEAVNTYLREVSGADFTAKDFRTWAGTVLAAMALQELEKIDTEAGRKKNIVRAIETVAERLGNTPTVSRKCYVHPAVLDAYLEGSTIKTLKKRAETEIVSHVGQLRAEEAVVLAFLQRRLAADTRAGPKRTTSVSRSSARARRVDARASPGRRA